MPEIKDYFKLHFIVLIWGFTAILGLLITIPQVELVLYRTLLAALLLAVLIAFRKKGYRVSNREGLKLLATGALIALHWILFFGAARVSNASICLAGMATSSLWTSLLEPMMSKKNIKVYEIIIAIVIMVGLYVIFQFEFNYVLGIVMAISSAFIAALFTVINTKLIVNHNHYTISFYEMAGAFLGTVLFLPFYQIYFAENQTLQLIPTSTDWIYIIILAFVCTVYAYTTSVKLMNKFSAFAINLTVNLEPVYGILLAFLFLNEKMTPGFYLGTCIILASVITYPYLDKYFTKISRKKEVRLEQVEQV